VFGGDDRTYLRVGISGDADPQLGNLLQQALANLLGRLLANRTITGMDMHRSPAEPKAPARTDDCDLEQVIQFKIARDAAWLLDLNRLRPGLPCSGVLAFVFALVAAFAIWQWVSAAIAERKAREAASQANVSLARNSQAAKNEGTRTRAGHHTIPIILSGEPPPVAALRLSAGAVTGCAE
jgi:hypothetical protein